MSIVYIKETLSDAELASHPEALLLDKAIAKLRDETTGLLMLRYKGHSRELSMCLAKLDEARLWAIAEAEKSGRIAIVDRAGILHAVTDTTDTTDNREHTADV